MKTQVAIIGAGPSGLFLGHLLRHAGIDCAIIERQSRDRVLRRIRAGVLETVTTGLMSRLGIDTRLNEEGLGEAAARCAFHSRLRRFSRAVASGDSHCF